LRGVWGVKKMKIRGVEQEIANKDFLLFILPVSPQGTPFAPRFRRYPKGAMILWVWGGSCILSEVEGPPHRPEDRWAPSAPGKEAVVL